MNKAKFIREHCSVVENRLYISRHRLFELAESLGILNKDNTFSKPFIENRLRCELRQMPGSHMFKVEWIEGV